MDLFYTYILTDSGDNHKSEVLYPKQDDADTAATGVDGLEANQGARTIPNNWYSGMIWDTTKDEWRDSNVSDLEDVEQLRFETQVTHDRLNFLRETLERLGPWYPQADVELVHEYLVFAHRGIRGVVSKYSC